MTVDLEDLLAAAYQAQTEEVQRGRPLIAMVGIGAGVALLLAAVAWFLIGCSPAQANAALPDRFNVQYHGMTWDAARDEYGIGYPRREGRGYSIGLEWDLPEVQR